MNAGPALARLPAALMPEGPEVPDTDVRRRVLSLVDTREVPELTRPRHHVIRQEDGVPERLGHLGHLASVSERQDEPKRVRVGCLGGWPRRAQAGGIEDIATSHKSPENARPT